MHPHISYIYYDNKTVKEGMQNSRYHHYIPFKLHWQLLKISAIILLMIEIIIIQSRVWKHSVEKSIVAKAVVKYYLE